MLYTIFLEKFDPEEKEWREIFEKVTESRYFDLAKEDGWNTSEHGIVTYHFPAERIVKEYHKNSSGSWRETAYNIIMMSDTPKQACKEILSELVNYESTLRDKYWEELEVWALKIMDVAEEHKVEISQLKIEVNAEI